MKLTTTTDLRGPYPSEYTRRLSIRYVAVAELKPDPNNFWTVSNFCGYGLGDYCLRVALRTSLSVSDKEATTK
jgi:hypothetical protein